MSAMERLEWRYRKLLAWYPDDHRAQHEDEMVGVLLQSAEPGQDKPTVHDTFDLLRGGLWLHLRRAFGPGSGESWRSAAAAAGAIGAYLLLAQFAVMAVTHLATSREVGWEAAASLGLAILAVMLGRANLRWPAAGAAWALVATQIIGARYVVNGMLPVELLAESSQFYLGIVTALGLTLTAKPRAGHAWLWHRRPFKLATLFAAAIAVDTLWVPVEMAQHPLLVVASIAMGCGFRTSLGRRVATLFAVPYLVQVVGILELYLLMRGWLGFLVLLLPCVLVVGTFLGRAVLEGTRPRVPA